MNDNQLRHRFNHEEVEIVDHEIKRQLLNQTDVDNAKAKGIEWFEENRELAIGLGVGAAFLIFLMCYCRCRRK
eukprot:scaffold1345_cov265-Chaetoceros_neogracile.AAC.5